MRPTGAQQMMLPKPGKVLKWTMIGLFSIWLVFALGLNWAGAEGRSFELLLGNTAAIARGEVWRLFTAALLHQPSGTIGHIIFTLLGLYFLGSSLEESWGGRRFAKFMALTAVLSYSTQFLLNWAFPGATAKLVGGVYFGATPVVDAIAIAWAFSFKGRTVNLMGILPMKSSTLVIVVVGMAVLQAIAGGGNYAGHVAIFAGLGWGYLLGGGSPTPLRRILLKYRLAALEREAEAERKTKKKRVQKSGLKVLPGGKDEDPPVLH